MANPMYRQIAETLRGEIESGELGPGQQLPTEIELRERFDASRNTVRDAIKWLTTLGLVGTRPGQGTFVVEKIDPFVTTLSGDPTGPGGGTEGTTYRSEVSAQSRVPSTSRIQLEIQEASAEVSAQLGLKKGAEVISRHERRFIDRTPWSLQTSFYPIEFADKGAELLRRAGDIEMGTVQYLAKSLGLKQTSYRDWIMVRTPRGAEAEFFKLPPDGRVDVFQILRTAFDQYGKPMRLTTTVYPTDRNQFIFNNGDVSAPLPGEEAENT